MPLSYQLYNAPAGNLVNGVIYIQDTTSGVFRPANSRDFANTINVTGLIFSGVTVDTTALNLITTSGVKAVTNSFQTIYNSQLVIPAGTRAWSFAVISGEAYVNGMGGVPAGVSMGSENYSINPIVIGASGASKAIAQWET